MDPNYNMILIISLFTLIAFSATVNSLRDGIKGKRGPYKNSIIAIMVLCMIFAVISLILVIHSSIKIIKN
jgi:tetrahydromethanopterin S-methyltransferase subunit B